MAETQWYNDASKDPFSQVGGGSYVNGTWYPSSHPLAQQSGSPTSPTATSGAVPSPNAPPTSANGALTSPTSTGAPTTVTGAFQQALMSQLTPGPVSAASPEVAPAITANKNAEQRNFEQQRAQTAERAASQGLDQNAFNSQLTGLGQERALREGQFAGNAVASLAQQRAQQITSALALAGGMLSDQDRMALQKELAQLQAQVQRESIASGNTLGQGDLTLRRDLGEGGLNLGLLNSLLGNEQYNSGLGAQLGMFGANLNQQAVLGLLGVL